MKYVFLLGPMVRLLYIICKHQYEDTILQFVGYLGSSIKHMGFGVNSSMGILLDT